MRIACVLVTHFRAKVEMLRHPHLKNSPALIVDRDTSRKRPLVVDGFPSSVENPMWASLRIPSLLDVDVGVRFLSCGPLLKPLELAPYLQGVQWVIVGGESGPRARPMKWRVGSSDPRRLRPRWRCVLLQAVGRRDTKVPGTPARRAHL